MAKTLTVGSRVHHVDQDNPVGSVIWIQSDTDHGTLARVRWDVSNKTSWYRPEDLVML